MEDKKGDALKPPRKLSLETYNILKTLGAGSYGTVKLAKSKTDGKHYAIKILQKAEIIKQQQVEHITAEFCILGSIRHPFIVNLEGVTQDRRYLYLVLEFIRGGELFTYLRGQQNFPLKQAQFYAAQVVLIFEYLHGLDIVYRDLKPENILIGEDGYLKLSDFGFAKKCKDKTYTLCGTPEYLAPEIILNKGHGKAVDWWAVGILIYELLVGIDPFTDEDPMNLYQNILNGKLMFPSEFDTNAKSLIKRLLQIDLSKRIGNLKGGVKDIKEHRFFFEYPWENLLKLKLPAPYIPKLKSMDDTSHFTECEDNLASAKTVKLEEDPFAKW